MLKLTDGMLLYHGSYLTVSEIDLGKCNAGLDFGRGFYVTTSYEQAVSFVPNSVKRNIRTGNIPENFRIDDGQISVYRYHEDSALSVRIFDDANLDWLHFVASKDYPVTYPVWRIKHHSFMKRLTTNPLLRLMYLNQSEQP